MKKLIKIVSVLLMFILVFLIVSIISLSLIRSKDLKKQKQYVKSLTSLYEDNYEQIGYDKFSKTDLRDQPLNKTRFLASHNSYKKRGSFIGRFLVGLGDSFKEARSLRYEYRPLTEQLQNGIFSFELDIRLRGDSFEVTHVPLVDNSSNSVNFKLALEEIDLFIENEDKTFPIIVLLEIKDDYMFLDPKLKKIGEEELIKLENDIISILGDKVYQPSELIGNNISLKDRVDKGWPTISELNNKVLFVIHAGKYSNLYSEVKNINEQVLFTSSYHDNISRNSVFIIHNQLNISTIQNLVDNNYMVRTRIGDTNGYSEEELNNALISKAQILTTDFSIARSDIKTYLYLEDKKYTIIVN